VWSDKIAQTKHPRVVLPLRTLCSHGFLNSEPRPVALSAGQGWGGDGMTNVVSEDADTEDQMLDQMIDRLTEAVTRRGFVGKLSAAAAALVLGVIALPVARGNTTVACCWLCDDPSQNCTGCCYTWTCCYQSGGGGMPLNILYQCKDCWPPNPCTGKCPSQCSSAKILSSC
jgi:hypothetical protein